MLFLLFSCLYLIYCLELSLAENYTLRCPFHINKSKKHLKWRNTEGIWPYLVLTENPACKTSVSLISTTTLLQCIMLTTARDMLCTSARSYSGSITSLSMVSSNTMSSWASVSCVSPQSFSIFLQQPRETPRQQWIANVSIFHASMRDKTCKWSRCRK